MSVSYDFAGQTSIVTGGARGIGRAIASQFVRSGPQVWIWDIHPVELVGARSLTVALALVLHFESRTHLGYNSTQIGFVNSGHERGSVRPHA